MRKCTKIRTLIYSGYIRPKVFFQFWTQIRVRIFVHFLIYYHGYKLSRESKNLGYLYTLFKHKVIYNMLYFSFLFRFTMDLTKINNYTQVTHKEVQFRTADNGKQIHLDLFIVKDSIVLKKLLE